jgi:hypothetical protein
LICAEDFGHFRTFADAVGSFRDFDGDRAETGHFGTFLGERSGSSAYLRDRRLVKLKRMGPPMSPGALRENDHERAARPAGSLKTRVYFCFRGFARCAFVITGAQRP